MSLSRYARYLFVGNDVIFASFWFPSVIPIVLLFPPSFINYHLWIKRFPLFNHKCTKRRARRVRPAALGMPYRTNLLSSRGFFQPWLLSIHGRINWSRLALAINLARVRQASGDVHARASQRGATLLSAFLLIAGCRQRYPPPRFWSGRTSEWRSLTERGRAYGFLYIGQSRTRANFIWAHDWTPVVVRDGIKLLHIFTVRSIQPHVLLSFHLNRNSMMDHPLFS